jgi:class 3 adenylate cyclase
MPVARSGTSTPSRTRRYGGLAKPSGELVGSEEAPTDTAIATLRQKLDALTAELAPTQRKVAADLLFDLASFSPTAHALGPEDVREVLELYFHPWRTANVRFGGRSKRHIGDAVMRVSKHLALIRGPQQEHCQSRSASSRNSPGCPAPSVSSGSS